MNSQKSTAASRNKEPILEVLKLYLTPKTRLLEIGSGNGEHAVFFSGKFPKTDWVMSETENNHPNIKSTINNINHKNLYGPEILKIGVDDFPTPKKPFDYVFTANTLQVMSWKEAKTMFKLFARRLREGSLVFIYGPFNFADKPISEGNINLDKRLKLKSEKSGIRKYEDVINGMEKSGFKLLGAHKMPLDNRLIVLERLAYKN